MSRGQMPMHNAPWYNGWNQMGNMYGGQTAQHSAGGWGKNQALLGFSKLSFPKTGI
jgi:hypothetical protein